MLYYLRYYYLFKYFYNSKLSLQAIYNVLVGALFCLLAWAVYYVVLVVLEPFLVPLFWAVMTGFVLHPYKTDFTEYVTKWIESLNNQDRPAVLTSIANFCQFIDWSCATIGSKIFSKWKMVMVVLITLPIYHYVTFYPLDVTTPVIISKIWNIFEIVEFISWPIVATLSITYFISVLILWTEERHGIFQMFGCCLWLVVALFAINLVWPPFWMLSMLGIILYSVSKFAKIIGDSKDEPDSKSKRMRFRRAVLTVLNRLNSTNHAIPEQTGSGNHYTGNLNQPSAASTPNPNLLNLDRVDKIEHPSVCALKSMKKPHLKNLNSPSISETPLSGNR